MGMIERFRRRRYRKAMWAAIQDACGNTSGLYANKVHPINGLRIIRDFERVNGVSFDPFDRLHRHATYGHRALVALRHMRMGLEKLSRDFKAAR